MQTLGLSDSTPRTESRLRSLFWPSIQNAADVDYLGTQGYWICTLIALVGFIGSAANANRSAGILMLLFYYLGGVGVRERSRYAATVVLISYLFESMISGLGVVRVLFTALLLSNLRATWIASNWMPESEGAAWPPRLNATWSDKFTDRLPSWLWPNIRVPYYIFSACFLVLSGIGVAVMSRRWR